MAINVNDRILLINKNATKQEKKIIRYIQERNIEDLINQTITSFADQASVAVATVLRFCRKLGLKGYSEFRLLLLQENYQSETNNSEDFATEI